MKNTKKVLSFLKGKKNVINGSIGLVIAYLAVKGYIGEAEVILFGGLNLTFFGVASVQTKSLKIK